MPSRKGFRPKVSAHLCPAFLREQAQVVTGAEDYTRLTARHPKSLLPKGEGSLCRRLDPGNLRETSEDSPGAARASRISVSESLAGTLDLQDRKRFGGPFTEGG